MSNIILQSNENSALVQTLVQSESNEIPSIYSTKRIYEPSSTNWYTIDKVSGSQADGQSVHFQLPKYGFLEQMLLSFSVTTTSSASVADADKTLTHPAGNVFRVINRVEFLSSSRIISTLYAEDIMAQFSNLHDEQLRPIGRTALVASAETGATAGTGAVTLTTNYCLPIRFGFNSDINTQRNLSFDEPCQLRVVFGSINNYQKVDAGFVGATFATVVSAPKLDLRYKMYNESATSELLAENYSAPQLNQLTTRAFRENPSAVLPVVATTGTSKITLDLKNIDVVQDYYFMVRESKTNYEATSANVLAEIVAIKILASGQEIASIGAQQLLYTRLTENGYAWGGDSSIAGYDLTRIAQVPTGLWEHDGGGVLSNCFSMREMNNVQAEITFLNLAVATSYQAVCSETCSTILSTSSSTGRVINSLSN